MADQPKHPDSAGRAAFNRFTQRRLKRFRQLVSYANENSCYYAKLIREREIDVKTCTSADFPELSKATLMENFDDIVTDSRLSKKHIADFLTLSKDPKDLFLDKFTVMHTSGTSGEAGYFVTQSADLRRAFRGMKLLRRQQEPGTKRWPIRGIRRQRVAFYGATGGHFAGVTAVARMQRGIARWFFQAEAFEVNAPLQKVIDDLNAFKPDILFGYTTALKMLGEKQQQGVLHIDPIAIAASGEMVTKADMDFLSQAFGAARVTSAYASTEHGIMGYSNPDRETMTLVDDNLVFEFYDDHSLITNLSNFTMPLIRYRMSDILRPINSEQTHPIAVKSLVGRSELMPSFKNISGEFDFISPHTINELFVKGVTRFQMQITGDTSFRFPICVEPQLTQVERSEVVTAVEKRLTEILLQKGLGNVTAEVPIVNAIALNAHTRKFQLIINNKNSEVVESA
ncbi:MAG: phenylacetate-CoA ligase [Pseudohongiellaceae bacterium]|jgi:phenylacetate-CoA ligase